MPRLIGLAGTRINNLGSSLKQQRQEQLSHFARIAPSLAKQEYETTIRDRTPDDAARRTAAARISKLRYGSG